jgi:hypothetical protein
MGGEARGTRGAFAELNQKNTGIVDAVLWALILKSRVVFVLTTTLTELQ